MLAKIRHIFCIFMWTAIFSTKIDKVITVTDWPSEWQTENASEVYIYAEMFTFDN